MVGKSEWIFLDPTVHIYWSCCTSTDPRFPPKTEHTDCVPLHAACTVWLVMPVRCACTHTRIYSRKKKFKKKKTRVPCNIDSCFGCVFSEQHFCVLFFCSCSLNFVVALDSTYIYIPLSGRINTPSVHAFKC